MQREREKEKGRHGNHSLATKHRKIIWHNLSFFLCKKTIYATTKIYLPQRHH